MTAQQVSRLFKPGVQFNVNELQEGRGSGLGLCIAKGICEQHGGTLVASSDGLGHGTTFVVNLPLYHVPDDALPVSLKRRSQVSGSHNHDHRSHLKESKTPMLQQQSGSGSDCSSLSTTASSYIKSRPLRILVVDDAAMNRKLLSRLLPNRNHSVDEANNGNEAVEAAKASMSSQQPFCYDTSKFMACFCPYLKI